MATGKPLTTVNGFVVQGEPIEWILETTTYRGISSRKTWPLSDVCTVEARTLSGELDVWFLRWYEYRESYALWVCPDVDLLKRYLGHCAASGVETRVVACASERAFPEVPYEVLTNFQDKMTFEGYDLVNASMDYSPIPDELFVNTPEEIEIFRAMLNHHGLFPSMEILRQYIEKRELLIKRGEDLEVIQCCEVGVYLVDA